MPSKLSAGVFFLFFLCLAFSRLPAQTSSGAASKPQGKAPAPAAGSRSDTALANKARALLRKAETLYRDAQYKEAENALSRLLKHHGKSAAAEEALVLLADIYLRQSKMEQAQSAIQKFRHGFESSPHAARMLRYQGQILMSQGNALEAAKTLAASAAAARYPALYQRNVRDLNALLEKGALTPEDWEAILEPLSGDSRLRAELTEKLGDDLLRQGKYRAALGVFEDWLDKFAGSEGTDRVRDKRKRAEAAPAQDKTLLIMAPFSGEFAEIGRSLKEGALLAVEENREKGGGNAQVRFLDDQGNLVVGVHRLRRIMRDEKIDALIGPAMSDVSAAVAADLSARGSKVPMITPTATTDGIAALGEGVFQINVTTGTLGQKIAAYATACLKLKDFAVLAPQSEYGRQLAEAFRKRVEKNGGAVLSVQFYEPGANDMRPQFLEIRQAAKLALERMGSVPDSSGKNASRDLDDSVLSLDGLFLAAANGEEAYKLAAQASFYKLKAQLLGSSGWNDRRLLHQGSPAAVGAYFSVDFQENPKAEKAEAWPVFQDAYSVKWGRTPDKVAGLAYDAARIMLQGLSAAAGEDQLIPSLKAIRSFDGVTGRIVFHEKYGANRNAAVYKVEKKGFKEADACPEAE